ncbi:MAG: hypothetical protein ACI89L_000309 [Phycisphaerales bacterium]|jgi:hypothetical protein
MSDPFGEAFSNKPVQREPHPAALTDEKILAECRVDRSRSSGPGGQNRNKVETHITLTHTPTGVSGQAGERRSQEENRRVALRRLRLALAVEVRVPVPAGDILSPLWRSRRKDRRIECNPRHQDFPSLLAEALDVFAACGWDPGKGAASSRLEISSSQLVKFVALHKPAFALMNAEREKRGMHALRA